MVSKPATSTAKLASSSPADAADKKSGWLSGNQKIALVGGLLVLVLLLGVALYSNPGDDPAPFTNYLYHAPQSGILMDVRGSPSANVSQKILQCGVNLVSSGFYATTQKNLSIYACDEKGCLGGPVATNSSSLNATNSNNTTLPFSDALYALRNSAYFHIRYGPEDRKVFHPTYVEVYVSPGSSAACAINIQ